MLRDDLHHVPFPRLHSWLHVKLHDHYELRAPLIGTLHLCIRRMTHRIDVCVHTQGLDIGFRNIRGYELDTLARALTGEELYGLTMQLIKIYSEDRRSTSPVSLV